MKVKNCILIIFILCLLSVELFGSEPKGPEGYRYLGKEGETIFLEKKSSVAYGVNGVFTYKNHIHGELTLNNATFGDPVPGVVKFGFYKEHEKQFEISDVLKKFPIIDEYTFGEILTSVKGVVYNGRIGIQRDLGARRVLNNAMVTLRLINDDEGYDTIDAACISRQDKRTGKDLDIWQQDNPLVEATLKAFFPAELATVIFQSWQQAKVSFNGVEYGMVGHTYDHYRRTDVPSYFTPRGTTYEPFAKVTLYTTPSHQWTFEVAKGINDDWILFKIHGYNQDYIITDSQEAFQNQLSPEEIKEADKPFVYGSLQKRRLKADPKWTYYIYLPSTYNPRKTYSLLLSFHGDGGSGRALAKKMTPFAEKNDFIILSPNFNYSSEAPAGIYGGEALYEAGWFEEEIASLFTVAKKRYIMGFSAGGGYTYGYVQNHPEKTAAIAINSSGFLNFGGFAIGADRNIPTLVTCGLNDYRADSHDQHYYDMLVLNYKKAGIGLYPGVGHTLSKEAVTSIEKFFSEVADDPGESYLRKFSKLFANLTMNKVAGNYKKFSEDDFYITEWDTGTIYYDNGLSQWRWKNTAGVSWGLIPDFAHERLKTGKDNPYHDDEEGLGKAFLLMFEYDDATKRYTSEISGFIFNGEVYFKN